MSKPVVIVGYPRSGTTILERIFHNVLSYSMSNEVGFIHRLSSKYRKNIIFDTKDEYSIFVSSLLKDIFFHYYQVIYTDTIKTPITVETVLAHSKQFSIRDATLAVLEIIAKNTDRSKICAKDPALANSLSFLYSLIPEAKVIHIVRDGRDCALSMRNLRWGDGNAYITARRWQKLLDNVSHSRSQCEIDLLEVRYEDILSKREPWLSILEFIQYDGDHSNAIELILNMFTGYTENFNKWKAALAPSDIYAFESVANRSLKSYDYETINSNARIGALKHSYYFIDGLFKEQIKKRDRSLKW